MSDRNEVRELHKDMHALEKDLHKLDKTLDRFAFGLLCIVLGISFVGAMVVNFTLASMLHIVFSAALILMMFRLKDKK